MLPKAAISWNTCAASVPNTLSATSVSIHEISKRSYCVKLRLHVSTHGNGSRGVSDVDLPVQVVIIVSSKRVSGPLLGCMHPHTSFLLSGS